MLLPDNSRRIYHNLKQRKVLSLMQRKQTKIIATISDRRCDPEFIDSLYHAGMNVVRLNTAHQTPEDTLKIITNVRKVSDEIALLLDTKGPEIRTAGIGEDITLAAGETITLTRDKSGEDSFYTSFPGLITELETGAKILIDDGATRLKVIRKNTDSILCEAPEGGIIGNRKSLNVPGVHLSLPSLTAKDREYIEFAVEHDIDFIAHSFVRNRDDVMAVQSILDTHNSPAKIIAKIENREGIDNLEEILDCVYGIMIARGDLGIEIPAAEVPLIQKQIIDRCITRARPVITATQMLHSMIDNPRPTRAEVSDIANAVLDGTDAIMLSGETAYGKYPLEAVRTMYDIACRIEESREKLREHKFTSPEPSHRVSNYLARTAVHSALDLGVSAILSDTTSGYSARYVASYRSKVPVCARTHDKRIVRELALSYGIIPFYTERSQNTDTLVMQSMSQLITRKIVTETDMVLILASSPDRLHGANLLEINTPHNCLHK